jgi:hypothetical protein
VLFEGHHRRASWRRASRLNHRGVAWEEGGHPGYLTTVGGLLTSGVYAGTVMTPDSWDVSAQGGSSWRTRCAGGKINMWCITRSGLSMDVKIDDSQQISPIYVTSQITP